MISHSLKCIFIHIPKTAGSSIEDVIWPGVRSESDLWMGMADMRNKYQTGALQHLLARQILSEVGSKIFYSYYKFSIVRNPWDRLVSQYIWTRDTNPALRQYIGLSTNSSFEEYLDLIQRVSHVHWERQVRFLRDEDGESMVDFVGRFENLEADARHIFGRIGLSCDKIPHTNASSRGVYRNYYNEHSKRLVSSLYREDIDAFGYEF